MAAVREIGAKLQGRDTVDGAGVRLHRIFGFNTIPAVDPFLLLDHFGSDKPDDYIRGFPWHPHRGIETVTYMINGVVEHGDSLGNKGTISSGDIQWMTAGSGIVHQEMPQRFDGFMHGFQLWVNLPAKKKMMDPRYRGILGSAVPKIDIGAAKVKVIAGTYQGIAGPASDLVVDVEYLDVSLAPHSRFIHAGKKGCRTFAYVFEGRAYFHGPFAPVENGGVVYRTGEGTMKIETKDVPARFLFISGKPINEPISWCGPIVMNTEAECELAFKEYEEGTFLKVKKVFGS
jgi:redox-sensitive bicupin YhaK (pirin superfamily)